MDTISIQVQISSIRIKYIIKSDLIIPGISGDGTVAVDESLFEDLDDLDLDDDDEDDPDYVP